MSDFGFPAINLLKNLFDQCDEQKDSDSDGEDALPKRTANSLGPGSIGKNKISQEPTVNSVMKKVDKKEETPRNMEEWEDMLKMDEDMLDTRKTPEYSIGYKQGVTTEDVYLGVI